MTIKNVTASDIEKIFAFYKIASNYQREKKTVIVWPDFDREMVINEIAENRQFKLLVNNEVVCIWAITFSDEQIWEDSNTDSAIYIHRIAVNPNFRGNNYINFMTWISIAVFICAFTYWMLQLKKFDDNSEEDKSISAHSFL